MKITKIDVIPLVRKLEKEFTGGTYKITSRNTIVTRVYTDLGIIGEAFGGDEDRWQPQVVSLMRDHLAPMLIGEDARHVERLWETMFHSNVDLGNRALHMIDMINRAILMQAIAAIDNAIWDALGKLYNVPLYRLLGGYRDRVPVIAIGGYYYPSDPKHTALQDEILGYQKSGIAGIKLKVGRVEISQDVERVKAVRQAVGGEFILACDANQAWTPEQAIEFCRAVAPFNVRWIEEPVRWYDQLGGLRAVAQAAPMPVVAGQGEITRFGCRDLIMHGGVDILNVDVTIAGGVTEWKRIAAMAGAFNVQMAHHEESQVALHLLASIPHGLYVEIFPNLQRDPLWYELQEERPAIQDGYMLLSDRPGLGLKLNEEVITRYRLD
jgi:L-alanine-DL-glutamate epimerase-like enolase superfamily enzyme